MNDKLTALENNLETALSNFMEWTESKSHEITDSDAQTAFLSMRDAVSGLFTDFKESVIDCLKND